MGKCANMPIEEYFPGQLFENSPATNLMLTIVSRMADNRQPYG